MEIPKFAFYKENSVSIWYFESMYCQSRFGPFAATGTNSCTLIALLAANYIAKKQLNIFARGPRLPNEVVHVFSKSINNGNQTYGRLLKSKQLENMNLSIPEALEALGNLVTDIEEWFFVQITVPKDETYTSTASFKISSVIKNGIELWRLKDIHYQYIFVVIIAASRTILLSFQDINNIVTMMDSHHHSENIGAIIAQAKFKDLNLLIQWIVKMFLKFYMLKPDVYELSFVIIKHPDR